MRITYRDQVYIAVATYEDRETLKEAGFAYHPSPDECRAGPYTCAACRLGLKRLWWTKRSESAARLVKFTDNAAKTALGKHLAAVEQSRATEADIEIPCPQGLAYFGYQRAGIAYMARREATLLGDEMGVGKTAQALGLINYDKTLRNILVVCPAVLRRNWYNEARRWLVRDERMWRYHLVYKDEKIPMDANFVIANYQRITIGYQRCKGVCKGERKKALECEVCYGTGDGSRSNEVCPRCNGRKTVFCPDCRGRGVFPSINLNVVDSIMARKWDAAIFDEAHMVKNPKAARTKAIIGNPAKRASGVSGKLGIVDQARKKLFLTGTPLPNRPIEMWPILSVCSPSEFGSLRAYAKRYCDAHFEFAGKNKKIWKADGSSNLEELQEKLRSTCLLRRLKKDVLKDLPPKTRQIITLDPTEKAKKLIAEELEVWNRKFGAELDMIQEAITVAEDNRSAADKSSAEGDKKDGTVYDEAVSRLKYIQNVAFMEMASMRRQVAVAKLPSVIEHLDGVFEEGVKKVVCFAHHQEVIETIAAHYKEKAVVIYGKTKEDDRQENIRRFQEDPKVTIFIGAIMAAGTGLTLTASSHVVFAELDWTPSNVTQAEDRCHRVGQKSNVFVQHLVLNGSLDARMAQILVEKQEIADRALDKSTDLSAMKGLLVGKVIEDVPPVPVWKKFLLQEAMAILAQRRDEDEGGRGFSKFDSIIGQKLATSAYQLSDKQAHLAFKLAKKYRGQLAPRLQEQLGIVEELPPALVRKRALEEERERRRLAMAGEGRPSDSIVNLILDFSGVLTPQQRGS